MTGLESGHHRRSLLTALAVAFGIAPRSVELGEAARRQTNDKKKNKKRKNKNKNKNKRKNRNRNGGGCQVRHSEQQILDFIAQAAKKYGQSRTVMERVARCESNLDPCTVNHAGPYYGLFQYLKSTWKTTPYSDRSIWDPEAQSLATAWAWQQGRKNEWACQ
jgi:hypothetical protein